jgi:hypothetical protein
VREAGQTALAENRHLIDVVREKIGAPPDWPALRDEANYLGATQAFIDRVLMNTDLDHQSRESAHAKE